MPTLLPCHSVTLPPHQPNIPMEDQERIPEGMSREKYQRLMAEVQAPYKGLRKFIYGAFGASGAIGAFIFLTQVLAGRDVAKTLPNLALQIGVVALMVFLFRLESRKNK